MDLKPADKAVGRDERRCPHCADTHIHRWGKPAGSQRYRCRNCGRTFNALTGTACAGLRRAELWIDYRAAIVEQLSIRKAAKRCGIDPSTALRWRRRLATPRAADREAALAPPPQAANRPSAARRDDMDFVDWVHAMRSRKDGGSMQAHVERVFGPDTRRRAAASERTPAKTRRVTAPRAG
jgi:predicted RNA-binding Zn-ribbon protein involved in translation (DUF1610 family)/transposase-like protein